MHRVLGGQAPTTMAGEAAADQQGESVRTKNALFSLCMRTKNAMSPHDAFVTILAWAAYPL
jgi:hypothetical protein